MKHTKKLLSAVLVLSLLLTSGFLTLAAYRDAEYRHDVKTSEFTQIPDTSFGGDNYKGVGGLATNVKTNKTEMYVCKSTSDEEYAALYYYPNVLDEEERDNYHVFRVPMAGHANGMAINSNYIYITGWVNNSNNQQTGNTNNNWIIEIALETVRGLKTQPDGTILTSTQYKILKPVYKNSDGDYVDYTKSFSSITNYKTENQFIIGRRITTDQSYYGYKFAEIEGSGNNRKFVVKTGLNSRFAIKNNLDEDNSSNIIKTVSQDICYHEEAGFMVAKWFGGDESGAYQDARKNVVLRIDLDNDPYQVVEIGGYDYKCYMPDNIVLDHSETEGRGVKKYSKFEIESIAVTKAKRVVISCNVVYTSDFQRVYKEQTNGGDIGGDRVFRLIHTDGSNVLLKNRNK